MRRVVADLHLHTALSPCAAREMTPGDIVREAVRKGLDMIAVCDHNSSGNARAVASAAFDVLAVIPGIEVTTAEEVHVLGLFPDAEAARRVSEAVLATLPVAETDVTPGGEQLLYGDDGEPSAIERRMLVAASSLDLAAAVDLIRANGGLAVAAHVDRPSFGVIGQLGFIPPEVRLDAAEVSAAGVARGRAAELARLGLPLVCGSDAHSLEEIAAGTTVLEVEGASFGELVLAVRGQDGRRCRCA
jgi:3',5'-nucleoside bisphosphate phosphatase